MLTKTLLPPTYHTVTLPLPPKVCFVILMYDPIDLSIFIKILSGMNVLSVGGIVVQYYYFIKCLYLQINIRCHEHFVISKVDLAN